MLRGFIEKLSEKSQGKKKDHLKVPCAKSSMSTNEKFKKYRQARFFEWKIDMLCDIDILFF